MTDESDNELTIQVPRLHLTRISPDFDAYVMYIGQKDETHVWLDVRGAVVLPIPDEDDGDATFGLWNIEPDPMHPVVWDSDRMGVGDTWKLDDNTESETFGKWIPAVPS